MNTRTLASTPKPTSRPDVREVELLKFINKDKLQRAKDIGYHRLYLSYPISKSNGKKRWLDAPQGELKELQYELLHNLLSNFEAHPSAIGFRSGVSVTAGPIKHLGAGVLLNLDFKDFFPSIGVSQVYKLVYWVADRLLELGLCGAWSPGDYNTFVSLVTCKNSLPQGSPASPILSNLIVRPLDEILQQIADENDLLYTRYADDITFSSSDRSKNIMSIYKEVELAVQSQKLELNPKKTRVLRPHQRMTVTGVVINEKLSVPKWKWRNFRALLHNLKKSQRPVDKLEYQQILGYAQWINQLHPQRGATFLKAIGELNLTP